MFRSYELNQPRETITSWAPNLGVPNLGVPNLGVPNLGTPNLGTTRIDRGYRRYKVLKKF